MDVQIGNGIWMMNHAASQCTCYFLKEPGKTLSWNKECPMHGLEIPVDLTSAGRIKADLEELLNEFHWSATVPKHRIREILNG